MFRVLGFWGSIHYVKMSVLHMRFMREGWKKIKEPQAEYNMNTEHDANYCRRSVVYSGYSGFLHQITDFHHHHFTALI